MTDDAALDAFMRDLEARSPHEDEFHQAVREVARRVLPMLDDKPIYRDLKILERMTEPDRVISFRVVWQDDDGAVRMNRGYRVQFNNAIGPYKGGVRFHPSVNLSVLKFLGFEQQFKNALTGLPMGGAKGGADFDPRGKSHAEIMRFCQAFMTELHRHIGPEEDVPAGDIGVGEKEVGYLFGQYKRITNRFEGSLTGKGLAFGGSEYRMEATGWGVIFFLAHMLAAQEEEIEGKRLVISGAGNVALHAAEQAIRQGAKVLTLSDSGGHLRVEDGLDAERLKQIADAKADGRTLADVADEIDGAAHRDGPPWGVACDVAAPCATENELQDAGAKALIDGGVRYVVEGANMPTDAAALKRLTDAGIVFGPGKAANAGGVALSGLEMSQNSVRRAWSDEALCEALEDTMRRIHDLCYDWGEAADGEDGPVDYLTGADRAGFHKVAEAMLAYGVM